ncbi:hypothetical protein D4R52_00170 [bacterium]|nr:MAG: hypothetical protein D4R52_00170 [bacterium]
METNQQLTQQKKSGPREVFLHLLAIVSLYASAGSFTSLLYQYINIWIPDTLDRTNYYTMQSAYSGIRWSIAILIVVFPVYLFTTRYLGRLYSQSSEIRASRIRKWLVYLTLFVAALVIIGDLVTLVFRLLGGEYTTRFLLKVVVVFFVSGSIFYYYFNDLKRTKVE